MSYGQNAPPPSYLTHDPHRTAQDPRPVPDSFNRQPPPLRSPYEPSEISHASTDFSRLQPTEEAEYHWTDDASTIRPADSVSQLGRSFTGIKRVRGPRALVEEEEPQEENYSWVPPEALQDDRSTVLVRKEEDVLRNGGGGGGGGGSSPLAGAAAAASPTGEGAAAYGHAQPYYPQDDEEEELRHSQFSNHRRDRSSADQPLVAGAAPFAMSSGPTSSYQGYDAVGGAHDSWDERGRHDESRVRGGEYDGEHLSEVGGIRMMNGAHNYSGATLVSAYDHAGKLGERESKFDEHDPYANDASSYPPPLFGSSSDTRAINDGAPLKPKPLLQRWLYDTTPTPLRIQEHQQGLGIQRRPWAVWVLSVIMACVTIYELVRMSQITGSPIQTKPSFNPMIGPSGAVLINLGARFAGCMKTITGVTDISWVCLASTNQAVVTSAEASCTMSDICGFGGFTTAPDQAFRFFTPIFLHAGVVHLLINLLGQCMSSAIVERQMGTPKFLVLYIASGVFGNVLGANFALVGQPSVGASGAIFGTTAALLVDLLAHWKIEHRPKRKLFGLILEIIVGLALGLVPGIDNFAHIGGFLMGLLLATLLLPIIHQSKRHRIIFILLRIIAAPLVLVVFVVLSRNFYTGDPTTMCSWCRYLSCWPTSANNRCQGTGLSTVTSSSFSYQSFVTLAFSTLLTLV